MSEYIVFPLDTEPADLLQDVYDYLQGRIPGWEPADGNLDVWLSEAFAEIASDIRDLASSVPASIFRYYGASVVGLQPIDAAAAQANTTWTMKDNAGYTIPVGTQVGIRDAFGDMQAFETTADYVVPPGTTTTPVGDVPILATLSGAASSGLGGAGAEMEILSPLEYVTAVSLSAVTSGGADAEPDDDYLNRLRTRMTILTPTPILPKDFAIMARDVPGVYRTVAIDGFIPPASTGQDRAVAVAGTDASGNALSVGVKAAVDTYLQSLREVNFVVSVIDPTYTSIKVTVQVHPKPGFSNVDQAVEDELTAFLSSLTWAIPDDGGPQDWELNTVVRYLEVAEAVNRADGVDYITTTGGNFDLQIAKQTDALARLDVALTGVAPLTQVGTLVVTLA